MGKDKITDIDRRVEFTKQSKKDYKRLKRSQPDLLTAVNSAIEAICKDPETGEEMVGNLAGFRSVHIDEFNFRIVHRLEGQRVIIHAVRNRKDVYQEMSRRLS